MEKTLRTLKIILCIMLSTAIVSLDVLPPVGVAAAVKDYGDDD